VIDSALHHWIEQFHQTRCRCVLALTGGGSAAAAQLLQVPGGSRSILEIVVPYDEQALADFLGYRPVQYCSPDTSAALAQRAADRARWLAADAAIVGLGCTASLVSEQPKRGEHRCHISTVFREQCRTWSLVMTKGARGRAGEEMLVAGLVFHALAATLGVPAPPPLPLLEDERVQANEPSRGPLASFFTAHGAPLYVDVDGRMQPDRAWTPSALLPGAFNPIHDGHCRLAQAAQELLQMPVAFELSVANVDKPELSCEEVRRRLTQFVWRAPVWLTHAAMFVQKAKHFPGAVFVVGADTAIRIVSARYYDNDSARMLAALDLLQQLSCRVLVACRADSAGCCLTLADVKVPADYRGLFAEIPAEQCRLDLSSTELRQLGHQA
jgi:hypothetical protein